MTPKRIVVGLVVLALLGGGGLVVQDYLEAEERTRLYYRSMKVVDMCGGGPPPEPEASPQPPPGQWRVGYAYEHQGEWLQTSAWPLEIVPVFIACVKSGETVLDTRAYVIEKTGERVTRERVRMHYDLRVLRTATGEELVSRRVPGPEPGPFPPVIDFANRNQIYGAKPDLTPVVDEIVGRVGRSP